MLCVCTYISDVMCVCLYVQHCMCVCAGGGEGMGGVCGCGLSYLEEEIQSSPESEYEVHRLKVTVSKVGSHLRTNNGSL